MMIRTMGAAGRGGAGVWCSIDGVFLGRDFCEEVEVCGVWGVMGCAMDVHMDVIVAAAACAIQDERVEFDPSSVVVVVVVVVNTRC